MLGDDLEAILFGDAELLHHDAMNAVAKRAAVLRRLSGTQGNTNEGHGKLPERRRPRIYAAAEAQVKAGGDRAASRSP